jgi:hypothetical protein
MTRLLELFIVKDIPAVDRKFGIGLLQYQYNAAATVCPRAILSKAHTGTPNGHTPHVSPFHRRMAHRASSRGATYIPTFAKLQ